MTEPRPDPTRPDAGPKNGAGAAQDLDEVHVLLAHRAEDKVQLKTDVATDSDKTKEIAGACQGGGKSAEESRIENDSEKRAVFHGPVYQLDLAKSVFQVHGIDAHGKTLITRQLRRGKVLYDRVDALGQRRCLIK